METNNELSDFKEMADKYYSKLTEKSPQKGIGSHEYIYFSYGIEWAFNNYAETEGKRLSEVATHWQKECDKLKEDSKTLLEALKNLLSSYRADFRTITGAELNETEAVKIAKEAIQKR